jgi:adenylosuccinate synthase
MSKEKQAIIVTDLTYGDAGKGSVIDYLARTHDAHTVVRFNGGAQAAHNVIAPEGLHHTFAQFGSGTFVPGTKTHLSRFMMVNPLSMFSEEEHLHGLGIENIFERTSVDEQALITTPFHIAANRLWEISRGNGRHGSCGMGIGETMSAFLEFGDQVVMAKDLLEPGTMQQKLEFMREVKWRSIENVVRNIPNSDQVKRELAVFSDPELIPTLIEVYQYFTNQVKITDEGYWKKLLNQPGTILFEGAQGVLLDEYYGFHPYTTWSTTTFQNALTLLSEADYQDPIIKLGLFRGYTTRHGAGPFMTEDKELTKKVPDMHNGLNAWQRDFRVGYFDMVAAKYAVELTKPDQLGFTCLDRLAEIDDWKVAQSYFLDGQEISQLPIKNNPKDMAVQEELTNKLLQVKPNYSSFQSQKYDSHAEALTGYLNGIEDELNVPISLWSVGPKAGDKIPIGGQNEFGNYQS